MKHYRSGPAGGTDATTAWTRTFELVTMSALFKRKDGMEFELRLCLVGKSPSAEKVC